jgi:drug/metabolite transporter (DMT)-like permease
VLWAGNSVSIKFGAVGLNVFEANAIRYVIAWVILFGQVRLARTAPPSTTPQGGWLPLLPAIIADAFFGSVFYVYGLSHSDLATGSALSSQAPLLSVPFAIMLGEERWSAARFAAVAATVTGIVLLLLAA